MVSWANMSSVTILLWISYGSVDSWPRSLRSLHSTWRCQLQGGPLHDVLPISIQQTHWSYAISRMARSHITLIINSSATFCFTKQNKAQSLTKTLPGTNSVHLKIGLNAPKRKIIFQPFFFAGVLVSGRINLSFVENFDKTSTASPHCWGRTSGLFCTAAMAKSTSNRRCLWAQVNWEIPNLP